MVALGAHRCHLPQPQPHSSSTTTRQRPHLQHLLRLRQQPLPHQLGLGRGLHRAHRRALWRQRPQRRSLALQCQQLQLSLPQVGLAAVAAAVPRLPPVAQQRLASTLASSGPLLPMAPLPVLAALPLVAVVAAAAVAAAATVASLCQTTAMPLAPPLESCPLRMEVAQVHSAWQAAASMATLEPRHHCLQRPPPWELPPLPTMGRRCNPQLPPLHQPVPLQQGHCATPLQLHLTSTDMCPSSIVDDVPFECAVIVVGSTRRVEY